MLHTCRVDSFEGEIIIDKPKLMQAAALLDQANYELMESFENDGMDGDDYDDAILFANNLIREARELILAPYDETKEVRQ